LALEVITQVDDKYVSQGPKQENLTIGKVTVFVLTFVGQKYKEKAEVHSCLDLHSFLYAIPIEVY